MENLFGAGRFYLSYGPMKSGKSELIVNMIKNINLSNKLGQSNFYQLFKPSVDTRDGPYIISRGNGIEPAKYDAKFIDSENPEYLLEQITSETKVIGIDELQFFSPKIVQTIELLLQDEYLIVGAGLDLDFKREPFGSMPQLINLSTHPQPKHAYCDECGNAAWLTQRLNPDRTPSSSTDEQVEIEQKNAEGKQLVETVEYIYEARCAKHYQMPDGPFKNM